MFLSEKGDIIDIIQFLADLLNLTFFYAQIVRLVTSVYSYGSSHVVFKNSQKNKRCLNFFKKE